jgi:hypothetical protein
MIPVKPINLIASDLFVLRYDLLITDAGLPELLVGEACGKIFFQSGRHSLAQKIIGYADLFVDKTIDKTIKGMLQNTGLNPKGI